MCSLLLKLSLEYFDVERALTTGLIHETNINSNGISNGISNNNKLKQHSNDQLKTTISLISDNSSQPKLKRRDK